jgi:hypothetical protein
LFTDNVDWAKAVALAFAAAPRLSATADATARLFVLKTFINFSFER